MPAGVAASGAPEAARGSLRKFLRRNPLAALHLLGPGLITGASDDDPSGIGTYSQVGSQYGYGLLWTALVTFPLMAAVQEMCARIALKTGHGLGTTLRQRFPVGVVGAAVAALLIANTLNVGADLAAIGAAVHLLVGGVPTLAVVVAAAILILAFQLFSTYPRLLSIFKWLTLALFAYVVTLIIARPHWLDLVGGAVVPHVELNAGFLAASVAVLGTTISPYLFFWQASSEVDELRARGTRHKRLKNRELVESRADVFIGMAFSQVVMFCIIATAAAVLHSHGQTAVTSAQTAAAALQPLAGRFAALLFTLGIVGTGLLAIPVLTGSAAYALRELLGFGGGLGLRPRYRPTFYGVIVIATVVGVSLNLLGFNPIRALFYTAVINGLVAPPLLILITVTACDRRIMGARASGPVSRVFSWGATLLMGAAAVGLIASLIPW
jgi:NRAMP (natural resistance-associated macrophage protein)-like metal ion transporter